MSLFDDHSYLRNHPHATEVEAAQRALGRSGSQRVKILEVIISKGEYGATDDECALALGMMPPRVATRRLELEEGGWIVKTSEVRKTRTGSSAIVWRATEKAVLELKKRKESEAE